MIRLDNYIIENFKNNVSEFARANCITRGAVLSMLRNGNYYVLDMKVIKVCRELKVNKWQ